MRDDDERALVAALRVDEFFERRDRADVEMVRRFVEKEQIRFERECERQGGALLFPARSLGRIGVDVEVEAMEHLLDAGAEPPDFAFVGNVLKTAAQGEAFKHGGRFGKEGFLFDKHRAQASNL